jgi:hypothetical protein
MVTMGADIADGQDSIRVNLLLDLERVGHDSRSIQQVRLHTARRDESSARQRGSGDKIQGGYMHILQGERGVERSVLIQAVAEVVLKAVIETETGMDHRLAVAKDIPGQT